jgi:hypothetical protein
MSNVTFAVGDLCTCEYDGRGGGLLYRVEETYLEGQIRIRPVIGVLVSTKNRKVRTLHGDWCQKITRVELASLTEELNDFVANETIADLSTPEEAA